MNTINGNFLERTIPSLKGTLVTLNIGNSTFEMNLEDLATTLGVGSGGGINPTSTYIPFNNEGTFADSYIINDTANSLLKFVYEGNDIGLKINFANGYGQLYSNTGSGLFYDGSVSAIGDYTFNNNGTYFFVEDYNSIIQSKYQNTDKGIYLDFANNAYKLGDFNLSNNGTHIAIDDVNSTIYTHGNNALNGLELNCLTEVYRLGDFNGNTNGTRLVVDNVNQIIKTQANGDKGLFLDFANNVYSLGDFGDTNNSTKLEIDDNNQKLILSANLETASAGDAAEKWLKVTIGTTDYLIALLNPPL
jgi:hypothetical protein